MPSFPERIPAIVLGSGNTALGSLRALGRRGIPTYVAHAQPNFERASRWYRAAPGDWARDSLAENLQSTGLDRAVLIPAADGAVIDAAALPPDLRARFPSSTPDADLLRQMIDKDGLASLLVEHDVPHPRTWSVRDSGDAARLPWAELPEVFLKPRDSVRFLARFKRKSIRPEGREAVLQALRELNADGWEMVLQEHIPGPPTNCYLIDGHVDREGSIRGVFARQRLRQFPRDFGNSSAIRSVSLGEVEQAWEDLRRFLGAIGYRGIFNAEFKRDDRDGSFRLLEVNTRAWWYVEFAARCGVDAVTMAYEDALEMPVHSSLEYDVGRTAVYPYYDLAACAELRRRGEIGRIEMLRSWAQSEQMIYAPDDPRPFLLATGELWGGYIRRRLPKLGPRTA